MDGGVIHRYGENQKEGAAVMRPKALYIYFGETEIIQKVLGNSIFHKLNNKSRLCSGVEYQSDGLRPTTDEFF